jgi:hypothetical protein
MSPLALCDRRLTDAIGPLRPSLGLGAWPGYTFALVSSKHCVAQFSGGIGFGLGCFKHSVVRFDPTFEFFHERGPNIVVLVMERTHA